jgi:FkbM family methyltransferase
MLRGITTGNTVMSPDLERLRWQLDSSIREYLLDAINTVHDGKVFVVQVGANDGKLNDPISSRVRARGWRGLFIEPVPEFFEMLKENYQDVPDLAFLNVACGRTHAVLPFWQVTNISELPYPWMRGLSTLNRQVIRSQFSSEAEFSRFVKQVDVNVVTLDSVLEKMNIDNVQVVVIDTEGHDQEVLMGFNAERYSPDLIFVEHHHLSVAQRTEMHTKLHRAGYLYAIGVFDTYFYRPEPLPFESINVLKLLEISRVA